ncbi:RNA polymerase sigma-70 factor, ECF subfamily protein [Minicystis rosea]|nr:RNA polymerase sigma-70 factor, ECF subfamily protein [Minicystis rosea]
MSTRELAADTGTGAPSTDATMAEKLAFIEQSRAALDERGIAVLRDVFPTLMRAHYDKVWKRILKWGVAAAEAEDLLQDAFLALFHHLARQGAEPDVRTILRGITKGKLLHHKRDRRSMSDVVGLPSSGSSLPETPPDVERAVDLRALAKRLLPELSEAQRAVVERVILGGQTHVEAAAALGLPEGTVKTHLLAAKRVLFMHAVPWLPPSQRDAA